MISLSVHYLCFMVIRVNGTWNYLVPAVLLILDVSILRQSRQRYLVLRGHCSCKKEIVNDDTTNVHKALITMSVPIFQNLKANTKTMFSDLKTDLQLSSFILSLHLNNSHQYSSWVKTEKQRHACWAFPLGISQ